MPAQQALPWGPELEEPQALEVETLPEKKIQLPINIGPIGRKNLNKYLNKGDTIFGFKYNNKDDEYYLGNTRVDFKGDDLEISGKRYPGTPGLWNLLTAKGKPVMGLATEDTALNIARSAGQKAGQKAIDFASSKLTPKSQPILSKLVSSTPPLAPQGATLQKAQQVTPNLNNLIAVSGQHAIKIQDLQTVE